MRGTMRTSMIPEHLGFATSLHNTKEIITGDNLV